MLEPIQESLSVGREIFFFYQLQKALAINKLGNGYKQPPHVWVSQWAQLVQ